MPISVKQRLALAAIFAISLTATDALADLRAPRPTLGRSPAYVEAVTADDFTESSSTAQTSATVATQPYEQRLLTAAPQALAAPPRRQPTGAFSGKIIYLLAGHGWSHDFKNQSWYSQRGAVLKMIEDLGTIDQANIFADQLYNAGATIVPMRPLGHQDIERVIDNEHPVQVELYGPWQTSSSTVYFGPKNARVPYVFARASMTESAVARFRPPIPTAGEYPVYGWARDGADRANQLFRVVHAGGTTEVRVPFTMVGKGWVWLGNYWLDAGTNGYVEVSNKVEDPYQGDGSRVVIADAVRFGNGRGDVNRGGGISQYNRMDEGNTYWIQRSLPQSVDPSIYRDLRADGSSTVQAAIQTSAYMNRETEGSFYDRLYWSFHSNATNSRNRGAVGLHNKDVGQRPPYQMELAQITGQRLNEEMTSRTGGLWPARARHIVGHINFGELRRDRILNEMSATIMESAFHDNAEDVDILLRADMRRDMARSNVRGILDWYAAINPSEPQRDMTPAAPSLTSVVADTTNSLRVTWTAPTHDDVRGPAPTRYNIDFGTHPRALTHRRSLPAPATSAVLHGIIGTTATFVRVSAANGSGETPSENTLAAALPAPIDVASTAPIYTQRALVITAFDSRDRSLNVLQTLVRPTSGERSDLPTVERVWPDFINDKNQLAYIATALTSNSVAFDATTPDAIPDSAALKNYTHILYLAGRQPAAFDRLTTSTADALSAFVQRGGNLIVSGASPLEAAVSSPALRTFATRTLGTQLDNITTAASGLQSTKLSPAASLDLPGYPDGPNHIRAAALAVPTSTKTRVLLQYDGPAIPRSQPLIAATLHNSGTSAGRVITCGFPIENIASESDRSTIIRTLLIALQETQ